MQACLTATLTTSRRAAHLGLQLGNHSLEGVLPPAPLRLHPQRGAHLQQGQQVLPLLWMPIGQPLCSPSRAMLAASEEQSSLQAHPFVVVFLPDFDGLPHACALLAKTLAVCPAKLLEHLLSPASVG